MVRRSGSRPRASWLTPGALRPALADCDILAVYSAGQLASIVPAWSSRVASHRALARGLRHLRAGIRPLTGLDARRGTAHVTPHAGRPGASQRSSSTRSIAISAIGLAARGLSRIHRSFLTCSVRGIASCLVSAVKTPSINLSWESPSCRVFSMRSRACCSRTGSVIVLSVTSVLPDWARARR